MPDIVKESKLRKITKNITRFFGDLKSEFKRITWPTREQLITNTIAVVVSCIIVGAFIAIVDAGLAKVLELFVVR